MQNSNDRNRITDYMRRRKRFTVPELQLKLDTGYGTLARVVDSLLAEGRLELADDDLTYTYLVKKTVSSLFEDDDGLGFLRSRLRGKYEIFDDDEDDEDDEEEYDDEEEDDEEDDDEEDDDDEDDGPFDGRSLSERWNELLRRRIAALQPDEPPRDETPPYVPKVSQNWPDRAELSRAINRTVWDIMTHRYADDRADAIRYARGEAKKSRAEGNVKTAELYDNVVKNLEGYTDGFYIWLRNLKRK